MADRKFYTEAAYLFGIFFLAIGTAFSTKADLGLSMIVAPAYLLHLKVSAVWSFFTFGMAEYVFQFFLLIVLMLVLRKFKISYFFSFITAVAYGLLLDVCLFLMAALPVQELWMRILWYSLGIVLATLGVAFMFKTYIAPEAYELFVKELAFGFQKDINKVKIIYDCASLVVAIAMSFAFFGLFQFEGVKAGTIVSAFVNAPLIALWGKVLGSRFNFVDRFSWRKYFEQD